jgi:hypothetical protein
MIWKKTSSQAPHHASALRGAAAGLSALASMAAFALLAIAPAIAQAGPQAGDPAPAFSLRGSDGKTYTLESIRKSGSKGLVLAFFPKAFTPG